MGAVWTVLLVEDSEDDAFFFSRAVRRSERLRFVGRARGGQEAIAYFNGEGEYGDREKYPYPDVVVLDLKMPGVDGFEVLEWLRGQEHRPKVCVYSSSEEPRDIKRAFELGADWYEAKGTGPTPGRSLVRAVETRLESRQ